MKHSYYNVNSSFFRFLKKFKSALIGLFKNNLIFLSLLLAVTIKSQSFAQNLRISQLELNSNGDVVIQYQLEDEKVERKYSIYLYASIDNYIQPLTKVTGDIGINQSVGEKKQIIWKSKEELGIEFKGNVALELKGSIYVPFISLDGFDDYKEFKRGKPYDITWTGGRGDNILNFELYQGQNKIKVFEERPNVGNTSLIIPTDVKPGEYSFKISDSRNRDEVVVTQPFLVKRKLPLLVKISGGVILGGLIGILSTSGTSGSETAPESKIGNPPIPSN